MKPFALLSITLLSTIGSSGASIINGFATKEAPPLSEIPNIAKQLRRLSSAGRKSNNQIAKTRVLKSKKSKKDSTNENAADEQQSNNQEEVVYPYIPEAPPEFNEAGELSFVILMDEFGYSTKDIKIGTKFAFSGRVATDEFQVGTSSGTCTIGSDKNTNFALCTFYLSFNSDGQNGKGTVTLSGNTDEVGGYMQVTGTGGDLININEGNAHLVFDPAGNPIVYILIRLN